MYMDETLVLKQMPLYMNGQINPAITAMDDFRNVPSAVSVSSRQESQQRNLRVKLHNHSYGLNKHV